MKEFNAKIKVLFYNGKVEVYERYYKDTFQSFVNFLIENKEKEQIDKIQIEIGA